MVVKRPDELKALGQIESDLEDRADFLLEAIRRAQAGYHGLTVSVVDTVNSVLAGSGYRLEKVLKRR